MPTYTPAAWTLIFASICAAPRPLFAPAEHIPPELGSSLTHLEMLLLAELKCLAAEEHTLQWRMVSTVGMGTAEVAASLRILANL